MANCVQVAEAVTDDEILAIARDSTARFTQLAVNIINSLQFSLQEHQQLLSALPSFEEKCLAIDNCKITRLLLDQIATDLKEHEMSFLVASGTTRAA